MNGQLVDNSLGRPPGAVPVLRPDKNQDTSNDNNGKKRAGNNDKQRVKQWQSAPRGRNRHKELATVALTGRASRGRVGTTGGRR